MPLQILSPRLAKLGVICGSLVASAALCGFYWLGRPATDRKASKWVQVEQLPGDLMLFDSVFWEPLDTLSLRELLQKQPEFIAGKSVLEIGTGSGLIALCCRHYGASRIVATDINPKAVECANANADRLGLPIDVRLVPSSPPWQANEISADGAPHDTPTESGGFSVIAPEEKFDLIISNPPWENGAPKQWSDFALYDENFALLRSILADAKQHLRPEGRLILVYGCLEAIEVTQRLANEYQYDVLVLDERDPSSLPDVFLPGMMLGLIPKGQPTPVQPQTP